MKLECIGCRQEKEFEVYDKYPICPECKEWEATRLENLKKQVDSYHTCSLCGYQGPAIDDHHIHGRKNSNVTIRVCCNCHREIHAGARSI